MAASSVSAYENQCAAVFHNGLASHALGKIKFGSYSFLSGSTHLLKAGEISQFLNNSSCGAGVKCQATGETSPAFPEFSPFSEWSLSIWGHQQYPNVTIGFTDVETYSANGEVRIEDLSLLAFSELKLYPGDYWVDELYVGLSAKLTLAAPGQVRIFAREVDLKSDAYMGDPDYPFLVYSADAEYSSGADAHVFHYSETNIDLDSFVEIHGGLVADNIDLDIDSKVYFHADKAASVNYGWICDYDGDGIYDALDADADNDGVSDELELQAGTDIYDEQSVPEDTDGDGIIDIIDDDIDNDGYSNQDEIDAGSDPYDAASIPLVLTIGQQSGQIVYSNAYTLTGLVSAGELNRVQIIVSNGSEEWRPSISPAGYFVQDVILDLGSNVFSIIATDDLGNQVSLGLEVTFTPPFNLVNIQPASGSDLTGLEQDIEVQISVEDGNAPEVWINDQVAIKHSTGEQQFRYVASLAMEPGNNEVEVEAISGIWSVKQSVNYDVTPEDLENYKAPVLVRALPVNGMRTASPSAYVYAEFTSTVGKLASSINGVSVPTTSSGNDRYVVQASHPLDGGSNTITISVLDALNQQTVHTISVERDITAPEIVLDDGWLAPPALNEIPSPAVTIRGSVQAPDTKSLKINGVNVSLSGGTAGYTFAQPLVIPPETETIVQLVAKDDLGNSSTTSLVFKALTALEMSWLTPQFPVNWFAEEGTGYPFAVNLSGATGAESFNAIITPGDISIPLSRIGPDVITGTLPADLEKGDYQLVISATSGAYVTQLQGGITVNSIADIPLEIVSSTPELNGTAYEPDTSLVVNFNRPVDPAKVAIEVRRTLHGETYVNKESSGADFFNSKGAELQEVHISRELVEGGISWVEGNRTMIFYPESDLGYNANIYWDIKYEGEVLESFRFNTRGLPTFIDGGLIDSLGQMRSDVTVTIKELGVNTRTNSDGGFAFGYNTPASENIPDGEYTFVVNPGRKIAELGVIEVPVSVVGGIRNRISLITVPNVDQSIAPSGYAPGVTELWLAGGDIKLGLQASGLIMPEEGSGVHAQFIPMSSNVRPVDEELAVFWLYQMQPFGIRPVDELDIKIKLPKFRGTYDYLLTQGQEDYNVLIVGYNPDKNLIEAVGVGLISGTTLTSAEGINLPSLDYLGYATPLLMHQPYFDQYLSGTMSFEELVYRVKTERPQ